MARVRLRAAVVAILVVSWVGVFMVVSFSRCDRWCAKKGGAAVLHCGGYRGANGRMGSDKHKEFYCVKLVLFADGGIACMCGCCGICRVEAVFLAVCQKNNGQLEA